jgi:hypothetical protein
MSKEKITKMRICEVPHIFLQPDILYRFTVDPDCDNCQSAVAPYKEKMVLCCCGREVLPWALHFCPHERAQIRPQVCVPCKSRRENVAKGDADKGPDPNLPQESQ